MLTKSDLKWLKENLTTKEDLKKLEKKLDKKFTDLFNFLDKDVMKNKRKIEKIEKVLQVSSMS